MSTHEPLGENDFEWGKVLGEGSFATVVLARLKTSKKSNLKIQLNSNTDYAVKKLDREFITRENKRSNKDIIKQINNEKDLLKKLGQSQSPFIVTLFAYFETSREIFYVLSHQNRGDLRELLNEKDALDVETSAFYLAEILAGVFFLHDRQIIHRDLKPENLLLGQSEHGIHIKICDFATAKDVSDCEEKIARTFVGSAEYVSPELLEADKNSDKGKYTCYESDLWAIGCIAYYMLSGLPPFRDPNDRTTLAKVAKADYTFPDKFHKCGKELIRSILKVQPEERLGANRNHSQIQSHRFFRDISWQNLHKQTPPEIKQYFLPANGDAFLGVGGLCLADGNRQSTIDDACGLGLRFVLSSSELDCALNEQKNKTHCASRWRKFVDNELIIKMGFMDKKRGLFSRTRMFLLTGGSKEKIPRLVYVDAVKGEKKGEIRFHKDVQIRQISFSRFYIIDPLLGRDGRTYDLTDKSSGFGINAGAQQWIKKLQNLMSIFFP